MASKGIEAIAAFSKDAIKPTLTPGKDFFDAGAIDCLAASGVVLGLLLGSKFFSPFALTLILQQVQILGIVAAAQSLVVPTAGIDPSVGAIAVISSVVMGQFTFRHGQHVEIAIACGLIFGRAIGSLNGWLIAVMKLPPFIVTLGMWQIVLAANFPHSSNETIRNQDIANNARL
jgi:fructose transport system permease protein